MKTADSGWFWAVYGALIGGDTDFHVMIDLSGVKPFGMHPKTTERAEVCGCGGFERYELGLTFDSSVRFGYFGILQVQKFCDTIHLSLFTRFHCRNIIRIETNKDKNRYDPCPFDILKQTPNLAPTERRTKKI